MANLTKLLTLSAITFTQLSRPTAPNPRLSVAISKTATTLKFVTPLLGSDGVVISEAMMTGVRKDTSYVESILIPSGALAYDAQTVAFTEGSVLTGGTSGAKAIIARDVDDGTTGTLTLVVHSGTFQNNETITDESGGSATSNGTLTAAISTDGLTATGCVRGINLDGLDWVTTDTDLAVTHKAGDAVFCNVAGVVAAMWNAVLTGTIATGGAGFTIGTEPGAAGETTTLFRTTTPGVKKGFFRWNSSFAQFSNDGTTWVNCSDVSASDLLKVSSDDTTPGYLNGKALGGDGISLTEGSGGGDETLTWAVVASDLITGDFGLEVSSNNFQVKLAATPGLEFSTGMQVKVKSGGGITKDSDGLSVEGGDVTTAYTYGATIAAGELLYLDPSDMKWKLVSSTTSTWYRRLGIAVDSGVDTDTGKRVRLKGVISGQSFSNINPTFSSALTGADQNVGDSVARDIVAFLVDNSSAAECVVTGGTISAKEVGTPAGAMQISLVLEDREGPPAAAFRDTSNHVVRGAIIESATIAEALFSGTYQDLPFTFAGSATIPADGQVYLCVSKTGVADGSNYYQCQTSGATAVLTSATQTWSGSANAGNITMTVTSTSPVGYSVKAYTGSNGTFGLAPTSPWNRPIGRVISSTEFYFDPEWKRSKVDQTGFDLDADAESGFVQVTTNFCPSSLAIDLVSQNDATTDVFKHYKGNLRGDKSFASQNRVDAYGQSSVPEDFAGAGPIRGGGGSFQALVINNDQNSVHVERLETGYYLYSGYPDGANFISDGQSGFSNLNVAFNIKAEV